MLSTYKLPFGVKIEEMAKKHPRAGYEPELSVGLVWKIDEPKATMRIHTTGSVTITGSESSSLFFINATRTRTLLLATSEEAAQEALRIVYPICEEFRCPLRQRDAKPTTAVATAAASRRRRPATSSLNQPALTSAYSAAAGRLNDAVPCKQPRKTAPIYDPSYSEFFEERMLFQDEDEFYDEHLC